MQRYLTIHDVAEMLQISERTIRRLYDSGKLAAANVSTSPKRRMLRFDPEDVKRLMTTSKPTEPVEQETLVPFKYLFQGKKRRA